VRDFTVKTIDVVIVKLAGRDGCASLDRRHAANTANAGNINVEVILGSWTGVAHLQDRGAGRVSRILVRNDLHPVDMFVSGNDRLRIDGDSIARPYENVNHVPATLGSIPIEKIANDFALFKRGSILVVISQPPPVEIPRRFLSDLWVITIEVGKGSASKIVQQFPVRSKTHFTGILLSGLFIFPERLDCFWFFDFKCVTLLNAIEEVFANHSLNFLPIVRTDSVAGLQIDFRSPEAVNKASK